MDYTCTLCNFTTRSDWQWSMHQHDVHHQAYAAEANLAALRAENAELMKFVNAFLDNFTDCEHCGASGWDYEINDNCPKCRATGEVIESVGVLYVELPAIARAILAKYGKE